jgi:hypothetical protein
MDMNSGRESKLDNIVIVIVIVIVIIIIRLFNYDGTGNRL